MIAIITNLLSHLLHSSGPDVVRVVLSNLSLSMARITERVLEVHALPVRAASGTFVPHGSERTLGRYLTAPVTLPPPATSDNLLRQGARAFAAHDCARGTYSHV